MAVTQCRFFSGYKPCGRNEVCDENCKEQDHVQTRLLLIHLGALGAVVRSTSLLRAIKRKFPQSHLTWVTDAPAHRLLESHALIDRVLTTSVEDQLVLRALEFDVAFCIDKSLKAAGVLKLTQADQVFGFSVDAQTGVILPATPAAEELWSLGISNQKKFFVNTKSEIQLTHEALDLGSYTRDEYDLRLTSVEKKSAQNRRALWQRQDGPVIGINTGCSNVIAAKKWTVDYQRELIRQLQGLGFANLVLLGGPEDTLRNQQIANGFDLISSDTESGLRDGLVSVEACDLILTGDSLGMHMAIARKKYVVAWFGPTCAHEIELFDRGEKLITKAACSPCWKRSCDKALMCYDQVELSEVLRAVEKGLSWIRSKNQFCLSKQPFSETFASVSPPLNT